MTQQDSPQAPAYLAVRALGKSFGTTPVLRDVSFEIEEGEFVCFLGPSGCGKTTLLLCLAGLEQPSTGGIFKRGDDITGLPASARDVGIVFQSYALFPNLSIADNIGFGLVNAGAPRAEIARKVAELVEMLSLQGHEKKFPSQLSGGQQQRVALARALAVSPSLLLLDEPLSALDAQVRARLRQEIRDLQRRLGLTTVMVTHDQEEAQTMADRIVVMHQGRIQQVGTPWEVYNQPRTPFVADFIGVANTLDGVVATVGPSGRIDIGGLLLSCDTSGLAAGQSVRCVARPEDISVQAPDGPPGWAASVSRVEYLGPVARLHLQVAGAAAVLLKADLPKTAFQSQALQPGQTVHLGFAGERLRLFPN